MFFRRAVRKSEVGSLKSSLNTLLLLFAGEGRCLSTLPSRSPSVAQALNGTGEVCGHVWRNRCLKLQLAA